MAEKPPSLRCVFVHFARRLALVLLLSSATLSAAPADATRREARERFDRGLKLFNQRDDGGALAEFQRAYELIPHPLVLYNIGVVQAAMKHPVEAVDALDRLIASPGDLSADRLAHARELRAEQAARIARIEIRSNVDGARIEVDGVDVGQAPLPEPLAVASGQHVIALVASGHAPSRRTVTVAGGRRQALDFQLVPLDGKLGMLEVDTPVLDADVVVDGVVVGKTPLAGPLSLAPGRHVVDVRRKAQAARDEAALRRNTQELSRYLSKGDIEFIDAFGDDRPLKEFANDFAMQNIALEFLRGRDPEAYKDYRTTTDGLIGRTKAYVKTAGSAVAFAGLVASFVNEGAMFLSDREPRKIYRILPLAGEFATAAGALAVRTYRSAETGIAIESSSWNILGREKRFRMIDASGEHIDETASGVFDALKASGEQKRFRGAMFSNGARGLLYKVYLCDPESTGRMLDGAVPDAMRGQFGEAFMGLPSGSGFYFVNVLTNPKLTKHGALVKDVLQRDQRKSGRNPAVGDVQRQVAADFANWTDSQFARMILANHHGPVRHAQMQVGGTIVRLIPTITAVYEYESYADSCRATAGRA